MPPIQPVGRYGYNHIVFGLGFNHAKITIIPKDQAKYANGKRFNNTLPDGRRCATIGAGPGGTTLDLVARLNRSHDVDRSRNTSDEELKLPDGVNEDEAISELFSAEGSYGNDLDYVLFPYFDGYNSNSFAHGLLNAVGFARYKAPPHAPGFDRPLLPSEFPLPKGKVTVEECPDGVCD